MRYIIIGLFAAVFLGACGSTQLPGLSAPSDAETAIKDTRISTDFRDQGIKIHYTLTGSIDRIEVWGLAPAWKGNVTVLAEADAKDKLVKFLHGESVSTERRTRIIARAVDRARDNTLNRFKTVDGVMETDSRDLERDTLPMSSDETRDKSNTSRRIADRVDTTLVNTLTTITASGRLVGVRKVRDQVVQDGRYYAALYQWNPRDQSAAESIRKMMR
jgi:hypothetical protein